MIYESNHSAALRHIRRLKEDIMIGHKAGSGVFAARRGAVICTTAETCFVYAKICSLLSSRGFYTYVLTWKPFKVITSYV